MRDPRTVLARLTVLATIALLAAQVGLLTSIRAGYAVALVGTLALVTALAALKLGRDHCVESHLVVLATAAVSTTGIVLDSTLGLPGAAPEAPTARGFVLLGSALLVLVLLSIGASRRTTLPRAESPYAL